MKPTGQVVGTAGFGLSGDTSWAANADVARVGRSGEVRTGAILDRLAKLPGGPVVMHDLTIPGSRANIDHLVISGDKILIVDSKVWKPGRYWTLAGKTRRGVERFTPAEKKTVEMARERLDALLSKSGVPHQLVTPILVVWPSRRDGAVRSSMLRVPGARVIAGDRLEAYVGKFITKNAANGIIVRHLTPLVPKAARNAGLTDSW